MIMPYFHLLLFESIMALTRKSLGSPFLGQILSPFNNHLSYHTLTFSPSLIDQALFLLIKSLPTVKLFQHHDAPLTLLCSQIYKAGKLALGMTTGRGESGECLPAPRARPTPYPRHGKNLPPSLTLASPRGPARLVNVF